MASATQEAETLTGKVVRIADGDTLTLLVDREQIKVWLLDIDATEKAQSFGTKARQELGRLVSGKTERVETVGKDKYKRTLGAAVSRRNGTPPTLPASVAPGRR